MSSKSQPSESVPSLSCRLVDALVAAGVDTMFGLPGGGPNLELIGAGADRGVRFVLAHGETAAAIMASTHGLLTAAPTPVVATRGPGAASIVNGVAQATLDRYPLVALTDTVPAVVNDRVAHQRLDQRAMLAPVAKASATVSDHTTDEELGELVAAARQWPYGGVHLDVDASSTAATRPQSEAVRQHEVTREAAAIDALVGARRPVIIVGVEAAAAALVDDRLGKAIVDLGCPVLTTYQAIGVIPTEGPWNAGLFTNGAMERPVLDSADLIVTIGLDSVEPIPARWHYDVPIIGVSAVSCPDDYLPTTFDLVGDLLGTVETFSGAVAERSTGWDWSPHAARRFREAARDRLAAGSPDRVRDGAFGPRELVVALAEAIPDDTTVTVDAGAHFLAVMPTWPVNRPFGLLISNGLATMGFAIPAAIGAALARPDESILALTGDGGASMVLAELETIARLDLPITVVVFNDQALSLIEIKQRSGQGGEHAVRYAPVDFAAIAEASGVSGHVVASVDQLTDVLSGDGGAGWYRPRLIDAQIDPAAYRHLIAVTRG